MSDEAVVDQEVEGQVEQAVESTPAPIETPAAPAAPAFLDMASERGYRFRNEQEALDALDRLADGLRENAPYADFGKNAVPHWSEFEEWRKQKEAAAKATAQPTQNPAWAPPKLDQMTLDTYFVRDSAGRYTPKANIPPEVAKQAAEWDAYTGRHMYKFRTNPLETLGELGYARKEEILGEVKNWYAQEQEKQRYEWEKQSTFESLKPLIIDKNTGRLNAYGARLTEVVTQLESEGITQPARVAALAKQIVDSEVILARQNTAANDGAIRAAASLPQTPGGPAAQNLPSRVPPANRPETPAPSNMGIHQLLKQVDPNFDYASMRKDLLGF